MKFKVGDRVKNKQNGEIFKITVVDRSYTNLSYCAKNKSGYEYWFEEEELESANYTYEDLKKSPTGTKITFENGEVLVKDNDGNYSNKKRWRDDSDLKELKDRINTLGKIVKIEEPEYTTVYEYKPEILDEAEKRYLKGVIRPFRDKAEYKVKYMVLKSFCSDEAYISIKLENDIINLPVFEINTMYKNMEKDKEYTLEELGL